MRSLLWITGSPVLLVQWFGRGLKLSENYQIPDGRQMWTIVLLSQVV